MNMKWTITEYDTRFEMYKILTIKWYLSYAVLYEQCACVVKSILALAVM